MTKFTEFVFAPTVAEVQAAKTEEEIVDVLMNCTVPHAEAVVYIFSELMSDVPEPGSAEKEELIRRYANRLFDYKTRNDKMGTNEKFWCWWRHEDLLFQNVTRNGEYVFTTFGDDVVVLSKEKALSLPHCNPNTF